MHRVQRVPARCVRSRETVSIILAAVIACAAALSLRESAFAASQYSVYAVKGASCSLALSWSPRLGSQKPQGPHDLLTGPPGWGCAAQLVLPHEGFCAQQSTGKVFGWGPILTKG